MKILSVRGQNIASLQDQFEIDFTREPLASAGLFAISGPTGAGKSTILDAICLALYHQTPRLASAPSSQVRIPDGQKESLLANDARNLLRRGAGAGFVEVEFVGVDRQHYRARWSINRARKSPDGALQEPGASLHHIKENRLLTAVRKEVREHVVRLVGLTFNEFTRSVLLAQNEFTSFLKASDNERAEILEKLTGNEIFSKIGSRIFRICATKKAERDYVRGQIQNEKVLDDTARSALQQQLELDAALANSLAGIAQDLHRLLSLSSDVEREQRSIARQESELQLATQRLETFRKTREQRHQALELSRQNHQVAQQTLAQAQGVEGQILALQPQLATSNENLATSEARLRELRTQRLALEQQQNTSQQRKSEIEAWLRTRENVQRWAENWGGNEALLANAEQLHATVRESSASLRSEDQNLSKNKGQIDSIAQELQVLDFSQANRKTEIENLSRALNDGETLSALMKKAEYLESEKQRLVRFLRLAELVVANSEQQTAGEVQRKDQERRVNTARESQVALSAQLEVLREQLHLAMQYKEQQEKRVAGNLHLLRSQLVEGQACPLCGATEHPLAVHAADVLDSAVTEARQRCSALERQVEEKTRDAQSAEVDLIRAQTELKNSAQRLAELSRTAEELRISSEQDGFSWPWESADVAARTQEKKQLEQQLVETREALKLVQQQTQRLQSLQNEFTAVEQQRSGKLNRQSELSALQAALKERLKGLSATQDDARRQLDEILAGLATVGSLTGWENNPRAFRERLRQEVDDWRNKTEELLACDTALQSLAPQLHAHVVMLSDAERACAAQRTQREALQGDINALSSDLRQLLGGISLSQFQERQNQQLAQAEALFAAAERELAQQQIAAAALEGGLKTTRQSLTALQQTFTQEREAVVLMAQQLQMPFDGRSDAEYADFVESELENLRQREIDALANLRTDNEARARRSQFTQQIEHMESELLHWEKLSKMIGSESGDKFRREAQRLTLEVLFAHANHHLLSIARRYQFRIPAQGQGILVEDLHFGGELRSVYSLSGGESFLLSLALAMGLASLSSERIHVESLFIDEGFGSLDAETLKVALDALDALQSQGRKVGVISHVGDMAERIGVQIQVKQIAPGLSRVVLP